MQRCFPLYRSCSDVSTVLEKEGHHLQVAPLAGTVQRRASLLNPCSDAIAAERHPSAAVLADVGRRFRAAGNEAALSESAHDRVKGT